MSDFIESIDIWRRRSLLDLVEFRNGVNFTQSSAGYAIKVVGVGDFQKNELLSDYSHIENIVLDGPVNENDLLENDDLLFVRSNGNKALIGRCLLIEGITEPITFSGFTIRARVTSGEVDPRFLSKLVRSPLFKAHLHRFGSGSSISNLSQETLSAFTFDLPPLSEQRRIAAILAAWDEALGKLDALCVAKSKLFDVLARRCFDECHPTNHRRNPAWRGWLLGDLFSERRETGDIGDRLLSITMNEGIIDREEVGRRDTSTEDKSTYKLIMPGDIGYNTMRMWQGVSALSSIRGIISPAYTVVTPRSDRIDARYAAHLFKSRRMVFDFERFSQGLTSDTWNLKFPAFSRIQVFLPDIDLQKRQAKLLDALKEEIALLQRQADAYVKQKRGLMQKLLTRGWRVTL